MDVGLCDSVGLVMVYIIIVVVLSSVVDVVRGIPAS